LKNLAFNSQEVLAQTSSRNFSEICIGLNTGYPKILGELGSLYNTNGIYGVKVNTNYTIGYFSMQVNFQENLPNQWHVPYNSWFFNFDYLAKIKLPHNFYFLLGPGLGNVYFRFYPNLPRKEYYFESEFFVNAEVNLHKKIGQRFSIYLGFSGTKVFTNPQFEQLALEAGLYYSFRNASKLQGWMQ
jgi:hypothetical protein